VPERFGVAIDGLLLKKLSLNKKIFTQTPSIEQTSNQEATTPRDKK
jgi:hypothetical protein